MDRSVPTYAASLSYYLAFSFFPLLALFSAILSMLNLDPDQVFLELARLLPSGVAELAADYVNYATTNQSVAILVFSILLILTSGSAAFRTLSSAVDRIFRRKPHPFYKKALLSGGMSLAVIILLYLSIVLVLTGGWFLSMMEDLLGIPFNLLHWRWLRFLLLFCLLFLVLTGFYRFATLGYGPRRPRIFPGALFASGAMVAVSVLFSYFIGLSSRYSVVYGSLASVILLLLWLFLIGNMILLGSVVNYVLYRHAQHRLDGVPLDDILDDH